MVDPQFELVEIGASTWRIGTLFGGRNLYQYLIGGGDDDDLCLLLDTGTANTPHEAILPALRALDIEPSRVIAAVVTHPDLDHQGGLAALRAALPNAILACGFADLGLVGDPERLISERYGAYLHAHRVGFTDDEQQDMRDQCGAPVWIDLPLVGGEELRLGSRTLRFLHAPGHSAGHLVVRDLGSGLVFTSDAVQGRMIPTVAGSPALPPTYEDVDAYLTTISMLRSIEPSALHSGHWPVIEGDSAVAAWLDECAEFVAQADAAILERLESSATLSDLCDYVDQKLGPYLSGPVAAMFIAHGHLRRMLRHGQVKASDIRKMPPRYEIAQG